MYKYNFDLGLVKVPCGHWVDTTHICSANCKNCNECFAYERFLKEIGVYH